MTNNDFMNVLSKTLLHSFWQAAIILLLILVLLHIFSNRSNIRYWISVIAFLGLPFLNIATFFVLWQPKKIAASDVLVHTIATTNLSFAVSGSGFWQQMTHYFIYAWIAGVFVFSLYRLLGLFYLQRLNKLAPLIDDQSDARLILHRWKSKLRIRQPVKIKVSSSIESPFTFGTLKPVIMMPAAMLEWITTDQLEMIILHELIHIKRCDYLIHFIISAIEIFYFFNPAVWIIKKIVSQEREFSCDFLANKILNEPLEYCKTLAQLQIAGVQLLPVLNFNQQKNMLMKRMQKLFGKYQPEFPLIPLITATLVLVFFISGFGPAPADQLNLNKTGEDLLWLSDKPPVPDKPEVAMTYRENPPETEQERNAANFTKVEKIAMPTEILDDTIKIRMRQEDEIEIKSKTDDKKIFLNNKEVDKNVLDNLDPEDIKSITVAENEIYIQTKAYKPKVELKVSNSLRVRSLDQKQEKPLFVLDGEIVSDNILQEIKPNDIESIEVLKEESAIAVYGEKGKHGVIIIKLKNGK